MVKKIKKYLIVILIALTGVGFSTAQESLTLQQAIDLALKNNYDIQIARNNLEIAVNNNTAGNAGMLPVVSGELSNSTNISNSRLEFFDREPRESPNARTDNLAAAAMVNWKIFDGLNMFISRKKLNELEKLGETELTLAITSILAEVIQNYYEVVQVEKLIQVTRSSISLSAERKKLAEKRLELGSGSLLEVNQAIVDIGADSLVLLQQEYQLNDSRYRLNVLLGLDPAKKFLLETPVIINPIPDLPVLIRMAESQNPELAAGQIGASVASLELTSAKAMRYPNIFLNGGYTFSQSKAEVGIYSLRSQYGPEFGITASMSLFNGFHTERNIKNARIQAESARIIQDKTKALVMQSVYSLYQHYLSNREIIRLENANLQAARSNVEIALEKFRQGLMNDIDLRTIQQKLNDAEYDLLNAQFRLKVAETELMRICGDYTGLSGDIPSEK